MSGKTQVRNPDRRLFHLYPEPRGNDVLIIRLSHGMMIYALSEIAQSLRDGGGSVELHFHGRLKETERMAVTPVEPLPEGGTQDAATVEPGGGGEGDTPPGE